MITLLYILTAIYNLLIAWIILGLGKIKNTLCADEPFVSVIIAARNEEKNIGDLLHALQHQDYPKSKYEIIVVDDDSQDQTTGIFLMYQRDHPEIHLQLLHSINRESAISPKKNALEQGIRHAKGEIILLTDADCLPLQTWISSTIKHFQPDVGMVIGFPPYEHPQINSLFDYLLALDSLSLAAVAAGTAGWGRPATCSGRNLAYRKQVFGQVDGFKQIENFVSGDDDLFLNLVTSQTQWRVAYAYSSESVVSTKLLTGFGQFFHQRIRHASKGLHYKLDKVFVLALVYCYNLLLMLCFLASIWQPSFFFPTILSLAVKAVFELVLLLIFAKKMKRMHFLKAYPVAALLHIPYVVLFGALGLSAKFTWKGEQFSKKNAHIQHFEGKI